MTNHLANEHGLYLRQHADNPVDWWPWGEPALATARRERKPILLSIGYSACHWCHVMAHESFENPDTAALMNALFVNIKVDREERPDIDSVYQSAHQALSGRGGGWPLTVFLEAETLLPFFAGTYFPPTPRHGLPAFAAVLQHVRAWHDEHPEERAQQSAELGAWLRRQSASTAGEMTDDAPLHTAQARWQQGFDTTHGGHRGAPKFPHASELELLLDLFDAEGDRSSPSAEDMLRKTLHGMIDGGLQDQLGGGFFRYSVDAQWEIPHFEKMLYDNAQLLGVYARAACRLHEPAFATSAHAAAQWLQRDMHLGNGGYAAALDADSEGQEGRYYVWQADAVRDQLQPATFAVAARHYGLDQPPNFEHHGWHLAARVDINTIASELSIEPAQASSVLEDARTTLLAQRSQRTPPVRDDKLLCAWNALAISALARSARYLNAPEFLQQAEDCLSALRRTLWQNRRLRAASTAATRGFLDSHAFLLDALLDLLAARWRRDDLDWAITLADALLSDFADIERGGFHFTANDHEVLPQRPKSFADDSLPNGNAVAARGLLRLGHLLGDTRYIDAAQGTLRTAAGVLNTHPDACASMLRALRIWQHPQATVLVRCIPETVVAWRKVLARPVADERVEAWLIADNDETLPGLLGERRMHGDGSAWLCAGLSCQPRIDAPAALHAALEG